MRRVSHEGACRGCQWRAVADAYAVNALLWTMILGGTGMFVWFRCT